MGETTRSTLLVVGYGNPLRQDDGFGYQVAERLLEMLLEHVQVIACHQLTPELAEPLSRSEAAVFVDAKWGEPVGLLEWQPVSSATAGGAPFAHSLTAADLMALAHTLYGSAPTQAYLLTVRSVHFAHGERLSPAVEEAIPHAITQIVQFLHRLQQ